ncbi:MAG: MoaD/ThiS family protein [Saprospiraceae bacterium]|nr:MoaD/ThiS family protein [Saprospiraceae bacterium]
MKIKCFGISRDITGADEVEIDISSNGISVSKLKSELLESYPGLSMVSQFFIAINHEYGGKNDIIRNDDEIAIIPPVSGG